MICFLVRCELTLTAAAAPRVDQRQTQVHYYPRQIHNQLKYGKSIVSVVESIKNLLGSLDGDAAAGGAGAAAGAV